MTGEDTIINAKIQSTQFGICDHGIMTFFLNLEWGGGGQGLGGYALDGGNPRRGSGIGILAIREILETVGVENWEDLKGKLVRVKHFGWGSIRKPIIGNIMEDKWFDLEAFMRENKP